MRLAGMGDSSDVWTGRLTLPGASQEPAGLAVCAVGVGGASPADVWDCVPALLESKVCTQIDLIWLPTAVVI
jgi:hypothetical protein